MSIDPVLLDDWHPVGLAAQLGPNPHPEHPKHPQHPEHPEHPEGSDPLGGQTPAGGVRVGGVRVGGVRAGEVQAGGVQVDGLPVGALPAGRMLATELLDTRVVLWRDSAGTPHAWEDRCPHRGTALSMGVIDGDQLRCAYHGWRFGADGSCRHIPALPALGAPQLKARVTTFQVQERYGMLWVCLGQPASPTPPAFPEFADQGLRKVWCGPYDVHSSGPRIVENFLDMAHFAFVHDGILGEAGHAAIADYQVERFDDAEYGSGVRAIGCRAWQPQASKAATSGSDIEYTYRVVRPLTAILTKHPPGALREAIALLAQPLTETTTRVWIILALADVDSDADDLRAFQDTIFLQDKPILESQRPARLPLIPGAEVSVACDRMSLAYRAYLKQLKLRYGVLRHEAPPD